MSKFHLRVLARSHVYNRAAVTAWQAGTNHDKTGADTLPRRTTKSPGSRVGQTIPWERVPMAPAVRVLGGVPAAAPGRWTRRSFLSAMRMGEGASHWSLHCYGHSRAGTPTKAAPVYAGPPQALRRHRDGFVTPEYLYSRKQIGRQASADRSLVWKINK